MRILLPILLAVLALPAHAQEVSGPAPTSNSGPESFFSLQYNSVFSGRVLALTYHQPFGERGWRAYLGVRYHVHRPKSDLAPTGTYEKSFFARNTAEHFGVKAGLEKGYQVFKKYPTELFAFWDTQLSHGALQESPYGIYDSLNRSVVTVFGTPYGDVTYWENNFGLGLRSRVTDRFGYRIFAGGGLVSIHERFPGFATGLGAIASTWTMEFGYNVGFGVEYHLR